MIAPNRTIFWIQRDGVSSSIPKKRRGSPQIRSRGSFPKISSAVEMRVGGCMYGTGRVLPGIQAWAHIQIFHHRCCTIDYLMPYYIPAGILKSPAAPAAVVPRILPVGLLWQNTVRPQSWLCNVSPKMFKMKIKIMPSCFLPPTLHKPLCVASMIFFIKFSVY